MNKLKKRLDLKALLKKNIIHTEKVNKEFFKSYLLVCFKNNGLELKLEQ